MKSREVGKVKTNVSTGVTGSARMAATVASSVRDSIANGVRLMLFGFLRPVGGCSGGVVGRFENTIENETKGNESEYENS